MNVNDDRSKLNILLSDNDTYEPCVRDPIKSWQQNYNRSLKSFFADFVEFNFPYLPYLYGLQKLHKNNIPLRPIKSASGSVTYRLPKYVAIILNGEISSSYVLNKNYFEERIIRNIDLSYKIMVSFDVNWRANIHSGLTQKKLKITPVIGKVG